MYATSIMYANKLYLVYGFNKTLAPIYLIAYVV